jgi:hypothetical protein
MVAEIPGCLNVPHKQDKYPFYCNYPFLHTSIVHFQLRNLVWATTCHDIYAVHSNCVKHWNVITKAVRTVIDLTGTEPGLHNVGQVHISTACAGHGFVAAGSESFFSPRKLILHGRTIPFFGACSGHLLTCWRMSGTWIASTTRTCSMVCASHCVGYASYKPHFG